MQNISSKPLWRPQIDHTENSSVQDTTSPAPVHPPTNIELKKEELLSLTEGKDIYWSGVASYLKTSGTNRVDVITHWVDSNPWYNLYDFLTAIAHTNGGNNRNVATKILEKLDENKLSHHTNHDRFCIYRAKHTILRIEPANASAHSIPSFLTPLSSSEDTAAKTTLKIRARKPAPHTQKPYTKRTGLNKQETAPSLQLMDPPEATQNKELWSKSLQFNIPSKLWPVIGETFLNPAQLEEISQSEPVTNNLLRDTQDIKMETVCNKLCIGSNFSIDMIIEKLHDTNSTLEENYGASHPFNPQILCAISDLERFKTFIFATKTPQHTEKVTFTPPEHLNWDRILKLMPSYSAQDISRLTPTYQEYYFYLTLALLPGCWYYFATTFLPSEDALIRIGSIYGDTDKMSTAYARLHKVCMILLQQNPTKNEIIECLNTALWNKTTPKLYTASLKQCLSYINEIKISSPDETV